MHVLHAWRGGGHIMWQGRCVFMKPYICYETWVGGSCRHLVVAGAAQLLQQLRVRAAEAGAGDQR